LLFYILDTQGKYLNKIRISFKTYHHTQFQDPTLSDTCVDPIS